MARGKQFWYLFGENFEVLEPVSLFLLRQSRSLLINFVPVPSPPPLCLIQHYHNPTLSSTIHLFRYHHVVPSRPASLVFALQETTVATQQLRLHVATNKPIRVPFLWHIFNPGSLSLDRRHSTDKLTSAPYAL